MDGPKVKGLPEMSIKDGKVEFQTVPTLVIVRKPISKIRGKYTTFLRINNHLLVKEGEKERGVGEEKVNLEHIVPRKPEKDWKKFLEENKIDLDDWVNKVGNLTILAKEYNRTISNKYFTAKRDMYAKSVLPLNKDLAKYELFGPKEMKEAQKRIGEIAEELWSV